MKKSSAKLNPLLRFIASGTLLVWLSAIVICQTHCCGDDGCAGAKNFIAHAGAADSHGGNKDHHDDSTCATLKTALQNDNAIALVKPDFGLAFNLNLLSAAMSVETSQSETFISNQPPDLNRTFTPEVCLGPAFRSLAPPSLA